MKFNFYILLFVVSLQTVFTAGALAAETLMAEAPRGDTTKKALQVLNDMNHALQSENYQGTIVYLHDGQVESMQLFHKKDGTGEYERLVHLSGAPREVVRNNDQVTCYMPDNQSVVVGSRNINNSLLVKPDTNFDSFVDSYSFSIVGEARVAGHAAQVVLIRPKDNYRYGYRIAIGHENSLLLKSELLNGDGKVLEQLMFAEINTVKDIPESLLKASTSSEKFTWHKSQSDLTQKSNVDSGWKITRLPSGFTLKGHYKQMMPNSRHAAEHMVVSDGLASISVYIEAFSAESQSFVGGSQMGVVNVYGSVLDDHQVTVVGEVPEPTVKMIAESVAYLPTK